MIQKVPTTNFRPVPSAPLSAPPVSVLFLRRPHLLWIICIHYIIRQGGGWHYDIVDIMEIYPRIIIEM